MNCDWRRLSIDEATGLVSIGVDADVDESLLDRESTDRVDVVVMATDRRHRVTTTRLVVYLSDENDRKPTFTAREYTAVIDENSLSFIQPVTVTVRTT